MKHNFYRLLCIGLLSIFAVSCSDESVAPAEVRDNPLAMGNPSGATTDPASYTNYLLEKPQYALSYHRDRGTPNWVSWHLSKAWLGNAPRQDNFLPDNALPNGWFRATSASYTGSGFNRGHNCPSADRTGSVADNSATFLMTNIIPQAPNNNQRTWADLENYCRTLVNEGNELYIICGSYGRGGTGSDGQANTIADGKITVPNRIWKVIVVLPAGSDDVSRVTADTRVISVNTPNTSNLNPEWATYRTSVDAIEKATGYDFLSALSVSVQSAVESKVDNGPAN